jgi:hypothetical protein
VGKFQLAKAAIEQTKVRGSPIAVLDKIPEMAVA